jgi:hypothetical protein
VRIAPRSRLLAAASVALTALLAGCGGGPPDPQAMGIAAASLDRVLPLVEDLQLTDAELGPPCPSLSYPRGTFRQSHEDCGPEGSMDFDAIAVADHARLVEAIEASGVDVERITLATYHPDGTLESAWFRLQDSSIEDDFLYLYDPTGSVPKVDGRDDFTAIDGQWWFVTSFDD